MSDVLNNEEESWEYADQYAGLIKTLPDRVSFLLSVLRREYGEGESGDPLSPRSLSYLREIDMLKSLRVPLYFGASRLFPEEFKTAEDNTSKAIISVLGPGLFASLVTCVWFYRRMGKLVNESLTDKISNNFLTDLELGYEIGSFLPDLKSTDGLLFAAMRSASLVTFAINDTDQFTRYLNLHRGAYNLDYEHDRFKCDHAQVAVYLLKSLHILKIKPNGQPFDGSELEVREAMLGRAGSPGIKDPWLKACAVCMKGVNSFYVDGKLDWMVDFGVSNSDLAKVKETSVRLKEGQYAFDWLKKGSS